MSPLVDCRNSRSANDFGDAENDGVAVGAAVEAEVDAIDPDLQSLIDAWRTLPAALKAGIVAVVRAGTGPRGDAAANRLDGQKTPHGGAP